MTVLYILGSVGGIIVLIEELVQFIKWIGVHRKKYMKFKSYYDKHHSEEGDRPTMGFKTEKEHEIEARMARKG